MLDLTLDRRRLEAATNRLARRLLEKRTAPDHWDGHLSSSALSTATAVLALSIAARQGYRRTERLDTFVQAGTAWLLQHQNADGGWGDTDRSGSNISTTAIVWATLSKVAPDDPAVATQAVAAIDRSTEWLRNRAGSLAPDALRSAILSRYGNDRTFAVPILTVLALTGKLGHDHAWRTIPQLPFELAALPHTWFQRLRLPVVSYALPALIAIGQVRHHFAPSRNPAARLLRDRVRHSTHTLLGAMQPESGGYLEAAPLTSFVVMSLAGMGWIDSPVVDAGVRFLVDTRRTDGSWPIDTNLSSWVTTLSILALDDTGTLPTESKAVMREWLLSRQSTREHPFTHAAPGAWAWTPLSGGVPDADDTSGTLLALRRLGDPDARTLAAATAGVAWLMGVQNRDGGVPTFCRGWGALPFDRSAPEITAHALHAWSVWHSLLGSELQHEVRTAVRRAVAFLDTSQRDDGSWVPLWFGNEHAPGEDNPVYGTARVLTGLCAELAQDRNAAEVGVANVATRCRRRGVAWLLEVQNRDGGWGGDRAVSSSIEETGVALTALAGSVADGDGQQIRQAAARGGQWLMNAVEERRPLPGGSSQGSGERGWASPVGLYFARLWYYEDLYPLVFGLSGLAGAVALAR
ncbi:MAG: squalene--hopene cyclase [Acidobacteria bacterium]|nr:MAG: squalene--hopene cyclase [Acidobacteriota bacterium]PYR46122.1 MAG: squalene--hopene cyclase [Acidobacteriota bacterium]